MYSYLCFQCYMCTQVDCQSAPINFINVILNFLKLFGCLFVSLELGFSMLRGMKCIRGKLLLEGFQDGCHGSQ